MSRILGSSLVGMAVLAFAAGAHAASPTQFDHYLCYRAARSKGEAKFAKPLPSRTLIDEFEGPLLYDAKNPTWHCNPVAKTHNSQTSVVNFPAIHLEGYPIALTKLPKGTPKQVEAEPRNRTTTDQFGTLQLVVKKPESLNVRTSKTPLATGPKYTACSPKKPCTSGVCVPAPSGPGFCVATDAFPAPPANDDSVDNFKCYKVGLQKGFKFTPIKGAVKLEDQFWAPVHTFDIVKPTRICMPVDKNGENPDAPTHAGQHVCYKTKLSAVPKGTVPPKDVFPKFKVADSNDNFPDRRLDVKAVKELCVPAATCGDGIVDQPFEECDLPGNTTQCPDGETCSATCKCLGPLGNRTFTLGTTSSYYSSFLPTNKAGTPSGQFVLTAGKPDGSDHATVSVTGPAYITIPVALAGLTICTKIESCTGDLYCSGGTNVDTTETLDSLASTLSCVQDGSNNCPNAPTNTCCSNACEGVGVGSGNAIVSASGVNPATNSGNGALLLICTQRTTTVNTASGVDCSAQDYSANPAEAAQYTTGSSTARVLNHCAGTSSGNNAATVPTFAKTGQNFDCSNWTLATGNGGFAFSLPAEQPSSLISGDGAQAGVLSGH